MDGKLQAALIHTCWTGVYGAIAWWCLWPSLGFRGCAGWTLLIGIMCHDAVVRAEGTKR